VGIGTIYSSQFRKYKGSKIEWDVDECEQPLQTAPRSSPSKIQHAPTPPKPSVKMRNRFATLRLDDDDNEENDNDRRDGSDDSFDTSTEFVMPSTVDVSA
jgi:hypothetical protein